MKKGLSILLIAAALFGFYGGATSLNDVLASKDYWEKVGEQSTADMNKLEDGLHQLGDNEQAYLDGKAQIADGEALLAEKEAEFAAAPGKLREGEETLAEGYEDYDKLKTLISGLREARKHGVATTSKHDTFWHDGYSYGGTEAAGYTDSGLKKARAVITKTISSNEQLPLIEVMIGQTPGTIKTRVTDASSYQSFDKAVLDSAKNFDDANAELKSFSGDLAGLMAKFATCTGDNANDVAGAVTGFWSKHPGVMTALTMMVQYGKDTPDHKVAAFVQALTQLKSVDNFPYEDVYAMTAQGFYTQMGTDDTLTNMISGYQKDLTDNADILRKWDKGYNTLLDGKATLASTSEGIPYAFKNMVTNSTIKAAIKQYDPKLMSILKKYKGNRLKNEQFGDAFDSDLVYLSKNVIPRCLKVLAKVRSSASKQLADGERQLAEGKAAYAAAPAQLEAGRQTLADGKKQLAQYEDGEQQVRDGLATLMATEPDGGLESILDRRNGDDQFDDENGHLDINEGLDAVEVGRGYQAESGELITKEITGRAVGTAAGLGAAVLAVLAAILSFAKKYKGAAVSAILAAVAGCAGALVGNNAGDEFSNIAGSTVGATPWIAAGVLAAVALVFAIAHFTTKPEA